MLLLASAFFLTLLQCSNAQNKTSITPADCNTIETDAGVALDLVNRHRRDGYVFGLFRVADAHKLHTGNSSVLYLTLDVLETECSVLSRRHWESCEYGDTYSMDFGQCKIITYTSQLLKKPHLYGFNCTLSPVPPDLLECKDCPVKVEVLEVTEQHKSIAAKALEKFNNEGNHTSYFNVDKVEKILKMTASREGHILEFSIKETNCSKSAQQEDQALECDFLDDWHAHVGFCKARIISDPDESDGTDISCEIYHPRNDYGQRCRYSALGQPHRHHHHLHHFGHRHHHRHRHRHGCPSYSQSRSEDPEHNHGFNEEHQDSHEGPVPPPHHGESHHHAHPPHHCPPPPPHCGPYHHPPHHCPPPPHHPHPPHHCPPPPPHCGPHPHPPHHCPPPPHHPHPPHHCPPPPPHCGPHHHPPHHCPPPPHHPHPPHHCPPPPHHPHPPHHCPPPPPHGGPHQHPPPPPHDGTHPPPQEEPQHPSSAPPPHDEPHNPPLSPHHGPHCPPPPHGPHHHHPPPHFGPHQHPPSPPPLLPPHDAPHPLPQDEPQHPSSAPPPHDEPHNPPLGPHHGPHCPPPPHGPHHHHPPPHFGPHHPPPPGHSPYVYHHYYRHHCKKTSISGKYSSFQIAGAVYRIPVLNQQDSLIPPTANFLELSQSSPHSSSTGEGIPFTGSSLKEMLEALGFPDHKSRSCPGNSKLVLPKILPLFPNHFVAENSPT